VYQEWLNDWYETQQTAYGLKEGSVGKLDSCNKCKIYKEQGTVLAKFCPAMEIHQNAII
jgi:hypothetical protein